MKVIALVTLTDRDPTTGKTIYTPPGGIVDLVAEEALRVVRLGFAREVESGHQKIEEPAIDQAPEQKTDRKKKK